MEKPEPVRFRMVLELKFPDADPWDPSDYDQLLEGVKQALESSATVNCKEVLIREALTIGPQDNYEDWRGGWKYDFSELGPHTSFLFGTSYPVPAVDPAELASVWELMERAERGEIKDVNIAIAIGQVLRPESDSTAILTRVSILRALQKKNAVATGASAAIFETAAGFPLERRPEDPEDLDPFARFFAT